MNRAAMRRTFCAMGVAAVCAMIVAAAPAAPAASSDATDHLAPLAFLAGQCWKSPFPDGKATDTHCFEWMFGGKFLRDRHVVEGGATPYEGETIYAFDPAKQEIVYWYVSSDGGISSGTVQVEGDRLVFPDETFVSEGVEMTIRSEWRREASDQYTAKAERRDGDAWREMWTMRFVPVTASPSTKP